MKRAIIFFILALPIVILTTGCSDKSKKEAQTPAPPPIDTMALIDTTPVVPIDTMPAEPEMPGMPRPPQGDGYAIQVASATDEAYARYLVDLWTGRGYEPFVETFTYNDELHYRLRLGLYMTYGEAKKVKDEIVDRFSMKVWIDQVSY